MRAEFLVRGGGEVKKEEAEGDGNEASEGVMCRCARGRRR